VDSNAVAVAVVPEKPVTEGHVLVLPKQHNVALSKDPGMWAEVLTLGARYAERHGGQWNLIATGGPGAADIVHSYVEVVPRRLDDGLCLPWDCRGEDGWA
jgi:histidine triad (HIT) family protein